MSQVLISDLFHLIQHSIEAIRPVKLVQAGLKLEHGLQGRSSVLAISSRLLFPGEPIGQDGRFVVNQNVYLVAFGKAALGKR